MSNTCQIPIVKQLPPELYSGVSKILIVGGSKYDFPLFLQEYERFHFWFEGEQEWSKKKNLPTEIKDIIISQSTPRTIVKKIQQMVGSDVRIVRFSFSNKELIKIIAGLLPRARLPVSFTEETLGENFSLPPSSPQTSIQEVAAPTEPKKDDTEDSKTAEQRGKRRMNKRGTIKKFILANANFSAEEVAQETRRLHTLAKDQQIVTSIESISISFYRLRKERLNSLEKKSGENLTPPQIPRAASAVPAQAIEKQISPVLQKPKGEGLAKTLASFEESLPVEATPTDTDNWHRTETSVWVSFYPNPRYKKRESGAHMPHRENDEILDSIGKIKRGEEQLWIGHITTRSESLPVFPDTNLIELIIEAEFQRIGQYPVDIPCFVSKKAIVWEAYAVDHARLRRERLLHANVFGELKERVVSLESEVLNLRHTAEKLKKMCWVQDMIVIIDYQNFEKGCLDHNINIQPPDLVHRASEFMSPVKRRIVRAVVVDFDLHKHRRWKSQKHFEFYAVPHPDKTKLSINPTDQYVYRATFEAIQKSQIHDKSMPEGSLVALITGDSDFVPLVRDLKLKGFEILIGGFFPDCISDGLIRCADYFMNLTPAVVQNGQDSVTVLRV